MTSFKFRVGDRVRCIKSDSDEATGMGFELGKEFVVAKSAHYSRNCYFPEHGNGVYEEYLELAGKTLRTLRPGDIIYEPDSFDPFRDMYEERKVVMANEDYVVTEDIWDSSNDLNVYTTGFLAEDEWVIKGNEAPVEMTIKEIADKLGIDSSKLRVKDDA